MNNRYKSAGFTLIELMIVLVIVGILAAVGYPSYQRQVLRAHRTEGLTALQQAATQMERYYTNNNAYAALGTVGVSTTSKSGYYTISVGNGPCGNATQCYTLTATATATGGQNKDTGCTALTLNSVGTKLPANCW